MLDKVLAEWDDIKLEIAIRDLESVRERVLKNIELEKSCIRQLDYIKADKLTDNKACKYRIINRKNAQVLQIENVIEINLDSDGVYDIWGNADNGVIVIREQLENQCNAVMKIETEFGSSSHCGIYIELLNGSRILFGSLGRLNMAIHSVDGKEKYELYMYQEVVEEDLRIGIRYDDKYCYFYSGEDDNSKYVLELNSVIAKAGYFAKTWENCECKVLIEDIQ